MLFSIGVCPPTLPQGCSLLDFHLLSINAGLYVPSHEMVGVLMNYRLYTCSLGPEEVSFRPISSHHLSLVFAVNSWQAADTQVEGRQHLKWH